MKNIVPSGITICMSFLFCILTFSNVQAQDKETSADWKTLQVVDVNALEWDERFRMGKKGTSTGKLLYRNDSGATQFV